MEGECPALLRAPCRGADQGPFSARPTRFSTAARPVAENRRCSAASRSRNTARRSSFAENTRRSRAWWMRSVVRSAPAPVTRQRIELWRLPKCSELEFGSVPREDDKEKYQGRAHDLKAFDEVTHFSESQYRFLIAWNRSAEPGGAAVSWRRAIRRSPPKAPGSPDTWGPWLDPTHPRPAKPPASCAGIRSCDGGDVEVAGRAKTRARAPFIPARLEDECPAVRATGYAAVLEGMPEPLRTMMREGRFDVGQSDAIPGDPDRLDRGSAGALEAGRLSRLRHAATPTSTVMAGRAGIAGWRGRQRTARLYSVG